MPLPFHPITNVRLDRFLARQKGWSAMTSRREILSGQVLVDGALPRNHQVEVTKFSEVTWKEERLQEGFERIYLAAHKPEGVLSATRDPVHRTIVDLIDHSLKESLHLAGRLDRSSTGLLLLSNDGTWTSRITAPENKLPKVYLVETVHPIPQAAIDRFREGFHFLPEDIHTRPAKLELLSDHRARVTLVEGRYHQIKRMFHRIDGIRLRSLHRLSIGSVSLDPDLPPGAWRPLTDAETDALRGPAGGDREIPWQENEK